MDEPQQIVSTRRLYCLQSHDLSTRRLQANQGTMTMCNESWHGALGDRCCLQEKPIPQNFVTNTYQEISILFVNTTITVKKDEIINASSSDFDLRGFQSLSGIWRRPTAGCSAKWLYWRDDQTVPLVLGSITIMIISYRATVLQSGG